MPAVSVPSDSASLLGLLSPRADHSSGVAYETEMLRYGFEAVADSLNKPLGPRRILPRR